MIAWLIEIVARLWCVISGRRYGDFMWCASGVHFYPLDPRPDELRVGDIARGLSNECRYAGQVLYYYSVADHSTTVSEQVERIARERGWCERDVRRAAIVGLFHDAGEAYLGDVIRPLKYQRTLRGYRRAERRVDRTVEAWLASQFGFRINRATLELVREVDSRLLVDEIPVLITGADMAIQRAKYGDPLGVMISLRAPRAAELAFLERARVLGVDVAA